MNDQNRPISTQHDYLLRLMLDTGRRIMLHLDTELQDAGISGVKLFVLMNIINNEGPMSISQLARIMRFGKSNATQIVDRMETDGLVRRVRNPEDRRGVVIEITDEGQARLNEGLQVRSRVAQELMGDISEEEMNQMIARLEKLYQAALRAEERTEDN